MNGHLSMPWWQDATYPDGALGFIPMFLSLNDPRPAREQIDDNYMAGWRPFAGFIFDPRTKALHYPGDPPLTPWAGTWLRDELIYVYRGSWVVVLQPDGSWEVAKLD